MAQENLKTDGSEDLDACQNERHQIITQNLTGRVLSETRILEYQNKAPVPPEVS